MKIAITMYDINNPGGIINHTEELARGFQAMGHTVDLLQLCWKDKVKEQKKKDRTGFSAGAFNIPVAQGHGWIFPASKRIPYKGKYLREQAQKRLNAYDLVIWTIPVPTQQAANEKNMDWLDLYKLSAPQILVIHDGNMLKAYPHITVAIEQAKGSAFVGLACVHPCAYHGAAGLAVPRAMILNPQPPAPQTILPWAQRARGFLSCQTFKGWKRVHELIEAIAYLPDPVTAVSTRLVAGGGIEHNYLTSVDKCKPQYHHQAGSKWPGRKFWDVALENGMNFLGYISNQERDRILGETTCLIDPSWSKSYAKVGDHFNRVVVDAIRMGAVPLARPLGISTNLAGEGEVFKAGEAYVAIPQDATPQQYADKIREACEMPDYVARAYQEAGQELFKHFDRNKIASQFLDLATGFDTGYYGKLETGGNWPNHSPDVQAASDKVMKEFFGG